MKQQSKIPLQVTTTDTSDDIARKIFAFIMYLSSVIEQDQSSEKASEVQQHLLFFLYHGRLQQNGLFAQDELIDLMRQAEIQTLGFSNLEINHTEFFDDTAVDIDNKILTKVCS